MSRKSEVLGPGDDTVMRSPPPVSPDHHIWQQQSSVQNSAQRKCMPYLQFGKGEKPDCAIVNGPAESTMVGLDLI